MCEYNDFFSRAQQLWREHSYGLTAGRSTKLQSERSALSGPISFLMPRTLSIDRDLLDRRALSAFTVFLGYAVFEACIAALSLWKRLAYIYCKSATLPSPRTGLYSCKKSAYACSPHKILSLPAINLFGIRIRYSTFNGRTIRYTIIESSRNKYSLKLLEITCD